MKKIILSSLVAAAVFLSGCLKDKDFEDNVYGSEPSGSKGVGFKNTQFSLALNSQTTPQSIVSVIVGLNADQLSATPINYTVVGAPNLVPADVSKLPASAYTFTATGTIAAGQWFDTLEIVIPNASALDPLLTHGIGLTITSVDAPYVVMANGSNAVIRFNVKNKYDGRYKVSGVHLRSPNNVPFTNIPMELITSGAASVDVFNTDRDEYSLPIGVAAGISSYGSAIAPRITFDPVTNNIIGVTNITPGVFVGLGPNPGKWDPVTRTITFQMYYTTGANQDYNNRGWDLTFTYVGPRP